jgi:glycine cleavage system regulatory protein
MDKLTHTPRILEQITYLIQPARETLKQIISNTYQSTVQKGAQFALEIKLSLLYNLQIVVLTQRTISSLNVF